jgi:hypothetical protein
MSSPAIDVGNRAGKRVSAGAARDLARHYLKATGLQDR